MLYSQTKGIANKYIIFLHGNSQSLETWDSLIIEESLNNYTLITVDLQGHGKSDRSIKPETEYTLKGMGIQIHDFIASYQDFDYIIVANSIATNFVAEIAPDLINCKGLFFTGACIIGESFTLADIFQPNPNLAASFIPYPTDEELNLLINDIAYSIPDELKQKCKNIFLSTDPSFRPILSEAIAAEDWSDEIKNLENINVPIAIVYGEKEKINHVNYLRRSAIKKWKNEILLIPGAGHCIQLDQPKLLSEMINDFAKDCFK
ncbi:MAG: alpha/beta hydrolase fold protein [Mucilaginibacter sp.]|nr:alpha/beta hydrolase fold protein [Mucilaginibacter sp.]